MAETSMPWVKLWTDFLDDPKIGPLSDQVKLRFIQLILLAGQCDADGALVIADNANVMHDKPMTQADVSWRLRVDSGQLADELKILTDAGVITDIGGVLTVTNFSERQGRSQSEKREKWRKWQTEHRASRKNVRPDTALTQGLVRDIESESVLESENKNKSSGASAPTASTESSMSQTDPAINRVEVQTRTPETVQFDAKSNAPAPVIEKKTDKPEKPRPRDLLFDAIAEVTESDITLQGSRIGKVTAEFRKINATPDQVRKVAAWFHAYDWRGQKGEKLTFELLKTVWVPGLKGGAPARSGGRIRPQTPEITDAQRAELNRQAAQRVAARDPTRIAKLEAQLTQARTDRANAEKRSSPSSVAYFEQMIASIEAKLTNERVPA